jgi:hypothetical protein
MNLDVKMVLIYVGGSALIIVGFSLTAIGIFFFYTEGRDLLNYMLHEGVGLMNILTELRHLLIACVVIAIGLLIGYIGIFILKDHRL